MRAKKSGTVETKVGGISVSASKAPEPRERLKAHPSPQSPQKEPTL